VVAVEVEEGDLEIAARAVALDAVEAQPLVLSLAHGAADEVRRYGTVEVFDGALDGGDRDVVRWVVSRLPRPPS
jgi:hypothetical protein